MTVLLVTEPGENGVFRYVEALAHFLVGQQVAVHLAYSGRRSGKQLPVLVDFIRRHGGVTLNLDIGNRPAPSDLRALFSLYAMVRAVRPDIIHSHSSKAGVLARALALFGVRARHVYHPHAYAGMRPQSRATRFLYNGLERVFGRWGITVNVSFDEQNYAHRSLGLPPGRTIHIPNGVDTHVFSPPTPAEKIALRRALGLPTDAFILGSLGRASVQKDPLTLYHAFAKSLEQHPALVLFHLGCGELDDSLNRFIAERRLEARIIRLPYLSTPADFYRAIDGFILTSLYEGLSLAILEALSCDQPLILSEAPGNNEFLQLPLSHVWAAPVGDIPAFSQAISQWAARRQAGVEETSSNHRSYALEQFDSQSCFGCILSLYRRLLAAGPVRSLGPIPGSSGQRRVSG